jgi:hypothetical protein
MATVLIQQTEYQNAVTASSFSQKCSLNAGVEEHAKSPDMGHILAGNQVKLPADIAAPGSRNRLPLLEHPIEELTTPQKPGTPAEAGTQAFSYSILRCLVQLCAMVG